MDNMVQKRVWKGLKGDLSVPSNASPSQISLHFATCLKAFPDHRYIICISFASLSYYSSLPAAFFLYTVSTQHSNLLTCLAVSLLNTGDIMGLPFESVVLAYFPLPGDIGGLRLVSLDDPKSLSWALNALVGLSPSFFFL